MFVFIKFEEQYIFITKSFGLHGKKNAAIELKQIE